MTTDDGFELAPCGLVVCNGGGGIIRANRFFRELTGLPDTFTMRTFGRCLTRPSQVIFNAKLMVQLHHAGKADEVALTLGGADGRGVPVLVNGRHVMTQAGEPEYHYAVFPARERREYETEYLDAKKALTQYRNYLRLAEKLVSVGHWHTDLATGNSYWSPEIYSIAGQDPKTYTPRMLGNVLLYHPDDRVRVQAVVDAAMAAGSDFSFNARLMLDDGSVRHIECSGLCERDETGKVTGLFGVLHDVSEFIQAREAVEASKEALAQAMIEANAAVDAKAQFLATMSHELRTPLTSIIGFSSLLKDMLIDADHKRFSQRIHTAGQGLLALINDILDHSKLEAGQLELDLTPASITDIAQDVVDLLELQAQSRRLELIIDGADDMPDPLMLDELRLRQILLNLVGNAVKFTEDGTVTIGLSLHGERLRVRVTDTGAGISAEGQQRLFKRFSQVDHSVGGTGLGLMICKQLVELMGGRIGVESRLGQGSLFWFELPVEACADEEVADDAPEPSNFQRPGRILVADDQPAVLDLVSVLLRGQGFAIDAVHNGAEAVGACLESAYDLILMDVNMPVMDGLLATAGIRSGSPLNTSTPIIGISAGGETRRRLCLGAGMNDMIEKPLKPAALMAAVTHWLQPSSAVSGGNAVNA